jgi:hypothetical protein
MRNEQFGAFLIQLQNIELSVRGSLSLSSRRSSSLIQVHRLVQRRSWSSDCLWTRTIGVSSAVWSHVMRAPEHCFSYVCVGVGNFINMCFKVSGWKHLKYVCAPLTVFLNDCLLFMYFIF